MAMRYDSVTRHAVLQLPSLADGIAVRGTTDGTRPTVSSKRYDDGTTLSAPTTTVVRLQAFWHDSRVGEERRVALTRHAALGARVHTEPAVDQRYPGTGAWSLVDGMLGSSDHGDGLWQGWWVPEVTITLELPVLTNVAELRVNFLQNVRSWIVLPGGVQFSWSVDGQTWSAPMTTTHDVPTSREGAITQAFAVSTPAGTRARFVRVIARARGPLPPGHPGAGQWPWLFADELRVITPSSARP
jgi:hexosaminidase